MRNARSLLIPILLFAAALLLAGCTPQQQDASRPQTAASGPVDRAAIEQVLRQATNDDVEDQAARLMLEQLAVDSGYALATWSRGDVAGQALLREDGGAWTVLAHDYGWLGVAAFHRKDVPDEVARRLLDQIDPNWPSYEKF